MLEAGGRRRVGSSRKGSMDVVGAESSAKIKEIDTNVPVSKKEPKQKSITKSASIDSSKASASISGAPQRASKTDSMPPPIKRAKKSNVGPWEQAPDTVQERLEANLAAEGMEDILEEVLSEVGASEAATERVSTHGADSSPRRKGLRDPSKAATVASPASRPKKTGTKVVDSDEDEFEKPKGTTTERRTRRNSSAVVDSFSTGPLAHSTPKPPPTTPKDRRPQPNMEPVGQQQKSSSSKAKSKAKAAPVVDAKKSDPFAVGPSKRPSVTASGFERLPGAQPPTVDKKPAVDRAASSSKQNSAHAPPPPAALRTSKSRSATPFVGKSENRIGRDLALQGQENIRAVGGPVSSVRKQKGSVSRSAQGRMEDGEERAPLVQETLEVVLNELSKRYTKRIKKTQTQAKDVQARLTSDTQKLAHHLVNRTEVIVEASKKHTAVLKELNKNILTTTREAKQQSELVVQELEKLSTREKRRASQWPDSFFA
ncbi:hypothetical protein BDY24DRAFT_383401 [Mrakia frigida]|uniref:uncharacterized protein n=1 Tax=Mrakia frigida TaxID=29902 RepID=UPI003FCBF5C2